MGKWNSHNPRKEYDSEVSVLGVFNLDHLHIIQHILLQQFLKYFYSILGSQKPHKPSPWKQSCKNVDLSVCNRTNQDTS